MTTPSGISRSNRVAVGLALVALLVSVALAGGPAVAKAINAATVDHKSAVGASASVKKRSGKLVATDKRTGLLPNNIIASAPDAARLGGAPASSYVTEAEAAAVTNEVVHAGGLDASTPFPAIGMITSPADFTTSKAGPLLVELTGSGQLGCPSGSFVHWWLQVDGVDVPNSRIQLGEAVAINFDYNGFPAIHLTGVTAAPVPAGTHTMRMVAGCSTGSNGGAASTSLPGVGSATVLRSGFTPGASARPAHPAPASTCVRTVTEDSCR
jgi:hypothetical protein